eukprot:g9470.t1
MRGLAAGRRLALAAAAFIAGASLDVIAAAPGDSNILNRPSRSADERKHLAVVVPAYQGDLDRAVASLERWPTNCSPLTVENVDLVLYYAEGEEDRSAVEEAAGAIASTAGRCFANLRIVYAHLEKEEDAYPKGPSVMFYKMFLDADVRSQLSEFDALAIVEWDVLVATDRSFEELYHAAFRVNEEFWVKGSNLEGTNLHSSAEVSEMWRVLGHINGNAIYNNNDPAFVEYIEYTRARWEYEYPYDVALWLTISDFPYSWPLYQRYSSKFVITNLISYVGYEHVTHDTVSDAIAGQTLFIHGSRVDDGSRAFIKSAAAAKQSKTKTERHWHHLADEEAVVGCGNDCADRKDTVCDASCGSNSHGDYGCNWKGLGAKCRHCYDDLEAALLADDVAKHHGGRVIMCSTMEPPQPQNFAGGLSADVLTLNDNSESSRKRRLKGANTTTPAEGLRRFFRWSDEGKMTEETSKFQANLELRELRDDTCNAVGCPFVSADEETGRVCDDSCETGDPYGTFGCGSRNGIYGPNCRFCFYDVARALKRDTPENRAIMCETMEPVEPTADDLCDMEGCPYVSADEEVGRVCDDSCESGEPYGTFGCGSKNGQFGPHCRFCFYDVERALKRDTPENRAIMCDTLKPVDIYAVATPPPTPALDPDCDVDGCPWIKSSGKVGRVCDVSCASGDPYGTLGCGARNGKYGPNCRFCYYDVERALENDTPEHRAIMCDTMMPVEPYSRRLIDTLDLSTSSRPKTEMVEMSKSERMFEEAASRPFQGDVTTGNLCAFVAGRAGEVDEWTVTVRSIRKFAPGMRVAVAAEEDAVVEYERALSSFPGVKVSSTVSAVTAGLYADKYCGVDGTSLIMYLNRGSVLSRSLTSKDTHSPRGELLVVHGNARASYRDSQLAKHTAFLLGSDAPAPPSFTYGTDLLLPVGANADVREQLLSVDAEEMQAAMKFLEDLDDLTAVPQVLAALQYSRQTEGIWFVDPQAWVSQHLFKETSIWDIPLVKPRFTCAISPTILRQRDDVDAADLLEDSLDFFSRGGKCPNGQIDVKPDGRRA